MQVHRNSLFSGFLVVLAIAALAYSVIALYKYYNYIRLNDEATPSSIEWSVHVEKKIWPFNLFWDDTYRIQGDYNFEAEDKMWHGTTQFKEKYLNEWAAKKAIEANKEKSRRIWYNGNKKNHSTLQKKFPLKECVSAGVLWALFLYFLWLGFYVANYRD